MAAAKAAAKAAAAAAISAAEETKAAAASVSSDLEKIEMSDFVSSRRKRQSETTTTYPTPSKCGKYLLQALDILPYGIIAYCMINCPFYFVEFHCKIYLQVI